MIMERIQEAKAGFRSLTEAIDTTIAQGRMMMQMSEHLLMRWISIVEGKRPTSSYRLWQERLKVR